MTMTEDDPAQPGAIGCPSGVQRGAVPRPPNAPIRKPNTGPNETVRRPAMIKIGVMIHFADRGNGPRPRPGRR